MTEEETQSIVEHERKKKKRKKIKEDEMEEEEENQRNLEEAKEKKKKKKKRKKIESEQEEEEQNPKKKRKKIESEQEEEEQNPTNVEEKKEIEIVEVKTEMVHEHPEKIAPIVGYFPSGYNPQTDEDGPQVKVYRKKDRPNRLQLVVSPKGSKVDFVGASHSGEAAASQVCVYALGVFDRESRTLKIVPIASNKILRLESRVGSSNSYDKELPKEVMEVNTTVSKEDKFRVLNSAYGTKRRNREDQKLANLKRTEDAETQKDLDVKIEGVQLNKEALETSGGTPARNIPPHDSAADTPEKAYPLDRIILKGERDYLLDILELVQSGTAISPDSYPAFVCNRIHKLMEIKDEEERTKNACILSYITHLIKFKDQRSEHNPASAKYHRIPAILNKKFLAMFADSEKFNPSIEKRNLLISYVLVLTLMVDEYRTEISDIVKDLKMTPTSLRDHYVNLGCKLKREGRSVFYTLPAPLAFPKPKMQRRRK